jgi:RNA polymerase sigma factor (sigma-70 family)
MRTPKLNDQELVNLYLAGDQLALDRLILRHKNKVFTSIYLMVKDEFLAENIFQETFIKAINSLRAGKYMDEGKFAPWIARIAYNLCMDHFRKTKRLPAIVTSDGDDVFSHFEFEETPVEEHIQRQDFEGQLKQLLEELPAEQREVIILRHYFNFSFKEVAGYTKSSVNTSLARMRYGLINLRKLIEKNHLAVKY